MAVNGCQMAVKFSGRSMEQVCDGLCMHKAGEGCVRKRVGERGGGDFAERQGVGRRRLVRAADLTLDRC